MLAIETQELSKKFGKFKAVDNLTLKIKEGEMYGLLGPNGSGKTTTIRMLVGLLRQTSGRAKVLGKVIPSKDVMMKVGYMPQESAVYVDNTVHDNLRLFSEIYCVPPEKVVRKEKELLRFVNLEKWKDALVSTLSGGMKHRLSLACSLVHEPKLLFLDEPTVGVDPELRAMFWDYFKELQGKGITVILTTHYVTEADNCSRVGLLRNGKMIAEDKPNVLKEMTGTGSLEDAFLALARRDGR